MTSSRILEGAVNAAAIRSHIRNRLAEHTAYIPGSRGQSCYKQAIRDRLDEHAAYVRVHGVDMPDVKDWRWPR